jgi:hypothetical protein
LLIHSRQGLALKKIKEKALGQVLRVVRRKPITPDIRVKWVPVELAKLGKRLFVTRCTALRGKHHHAPSSGAKLVRPARR